MISLLAWLNSLKHDHYYCFRLPATNTYGKTAQNQLFWKEFAREALLRRMADPAEGFIA